MKRRRASDAMQSDQSRERLIPARTEPGESARNPVAAILLLGLALASPVGAITPIGAHAQATAPQVCEVGRISTTTVDNRSTF